MTRITHRTIQESTLANLQRNVTAMGALQERLSTGKNINRASDDPTGTVSVLQLRQDLRNVEQYSRNADDGLGWLGSVDTALQATQSQLRKAQELTLSALSSGSQSGDSREAIALEIESISSAVVGLANAKYLDRSVFAGTAGPGDAVVVSGTGPARTYRFASTGTTTGTGGGEVLRRIDAATQIRVDTDGREVFGDDGTGQSVFSLLDTIARQIRTMPNAGTSGTTPADAAAAAAATADLETSFKALQARVSRVSAAQSAAGTNMNRLSSAQDAAEDKKVTLSSALSDVEDTDLPETIVQLQMQEVAYKAALGATAKVLQPSLMDFLR